MAIHEEYQSACLKKLCLAKSGYYQVQVATKWFISVELQSGEKFCEGFIAATSFMLQAVISMIVVMKNID